MLKNKKKIIVIVIIIFVCLVVCLWMMLKKAQRNENKVENPINLHIAHFNIEGRATLMVGDSICLGNNIKELENGFYDIKILNNEYGVEVHLNKLWYDSYGKDFIQDEYLAKICREISNRLNAKNNKAQLEYVLYKYIKDNYINVKQNEHVQEIVTDELKLGLELEDSIVKLIIQRGN